MELIDRAKAFIELGFQLKNVDGDVLETLFAKALIQNPWFTKENIELSFAGLKRYLDESKIKTWINRYHFQKRSKKRIGVVMAGNIPMVGIHDMICVLLSGHKLIAKLSGQDDVLIPFIVDSLIKINPYFRDQIEIVEQLKDFDAVIATGSDNTARYFDYYFGNYPNIIRKNRTSVALLNDRETEEDKHKLAHDIFSYFGLGCRNVSKIFVPAGYCVKELLPHFENNKYLSNHNKYSNNYYYNKSVLLVNNTDHLDGRFFLFQESENLVSPISMVYYEYYSDFNELKELIKNQEQKIQCVVTNIKDIDQKVNFGEAQKPEIWDYADNIDTMKFLTSL